MELEKTWLQHFKEVVAKEIAATGRNADGYRAVSEKTGLGEQYIYQIYTGKPVASPKMPTVEVMDKIERAYSNGRPRGWTNTQAYELAGEPREYKKQEVRMELSQQALQIAALFDLIPEGDVLRRGKAAAAAQTVIVAVIEGHTLQPILRQEEDQKKQSV